MSKSRGVVIQPSALRAIHLKFFSVPAAPTSTGMCDWIGFGHAQLGPNFTNSPSYDASSSVHSARMASRYSRSMVRRRPDGTLWSASSSVFQPNPTPTLTRPPDR